MKLIRTLLLTFVAFGASQVSSEAWFKFGTVYCDANTNGIIDTGDVPVVSVLVVVTNSSGTFSNADWTAADGTFLIELPDAPDMYFDYINPDTLPAGTVSVSPDLATFQTDANDTIITNDFLIENPACLNVPPPTTNGPCWLTGCGTIVCGQGHGRGHEHKGHSFVGVVYPGCQAAAPSTWEDLDYVAKLEFCSTQMEVVTCGTIPGVPASCGSQTNGFNYIDFQGVGFLKGVGCNPTNYGYVQFYARCEDHSGTGGCPSCGGGEGDEHHRDGGGDSDGGGNQHNHGHGNQHPGAGHKGNNHGAGHGHGHGAGLSGHGEDHHSHTADRYYLLVTDGQGNVLMLVSTDQANPTDIAPVTIASGHLQLHEAGCGQ
jgi:hypothetical protein